MILNYLKDNNMSYLVTKVSNNFDNYNPESNYRWYYEKYYDEDFDEIVLGTPQFQKDLPTSTQDSIYYVNASDNGRLDIIANKFYGSKYKDLMWIIMLYNGIEDPLAELEINRQLYIPDMSAIQGTLI